MILPDATILGPFDREEWLIARKHGLGGSDIGALLGLSTYTSALEVYYSKTSDPPKEDSEIMEWGRLLEPVVTHKWADEQEVEVDDSLVILQNKEMPWLRHSPDGLIVKDGKYVAGLEVKVIRSDRAWDPLPPFYEAQVQHGLLVSGLDEWHVVALVSGQKLIHRVVKPDHGIFAQIIKTADRFWHDKVLLGIPPEPDGSDSAGKALRNQYAGGGETVDIDIALWNRYQECASMAKTWEGEKKKWEQEIQAIMGDAEAVTADGAVVATWKAGTRSAIDTKRLKAELPDIAEKFTKTSSTRTFRPK